MDHGAWIALLIKSFERSPGNRGLLDPLEREEWIMTRYEAIINVPGYLPQADEPSIFDDMSNAWAFLLDERLRDLDDPMNDIGDDVADDCSEELAGMILNPELGTVYGWTPGYDGDHDLGLAYSVTEYHGEDDDHE